MGTELSLTRDWVVDSFRARGQGRLGSGQECRQPALHLVLMSSGCVFLNGSQLLTAAEDKEAPREKHLALAQSRSWSNFYC